jgi:hypothetical protein
VKGFCPLLIASCCLAVATAAAADEGKRHTLTDLQALAAQSSWKELIEHLGDVQPAERGDPWLRLAEQAGVEAFDASVARDQPALSIQLGISLLDQYPQLKTSHPFMGKRAEVGLSALARCFDSRGQSELCGRLLTIFAAQDPDNLDLSFKAGKMASRHLKRWYTVSFFRRALAHPSTSRSCGDEDLRLAVLSGLGQKDAPEFKTAVEDARVVLRDECWAELKGPALEGFHEGSPAFQKNTCDILKAKQALGKIDAVVCANIAPEAL